MKISAMILCLSLSSSCDVLLRQPSSNDNSTAALLALAAAASGTTVGAGTGNANIASISPTNNQVLTTSTTTIVVTFTSAMNTSSVQSAFAVNDGTSNLGGTFAWSNSNKTVTFTPTALTAFKVHTVTITSSALTSGGTSIGSASFSFRIGPFFQANGLYWQSGNATCYTTAADFTTATNYCAGLGMRLPTFIFPNTGEWGLAYTGNVAALFNPGGGAGNSYWSSTVSSPGHKTVYDNSGSIGNSSTADTTGTILVRCVL